MVNVYEGWQFYRKYKGTKKIKAKLFGNRVVTNRIHAHATVNLTIMAIQRQFGSRGRGNWILAVCFIVVFTVLVSWDRFPNTLPPHHLMIEEKNWGINSTIEEEVFVTGVTKRHMHISGIIRKRKRSIVCFIIYVNAECLG